MFTKKLMKFAESAKSNVEYCEKYKRVNADFELNLSDYARYIDTDIDYIQLKANKRQMKELNKYFKENVYDKLGSLIVLNDNLFNKVKDFYGFDDSNNFEFYKEFSLKVLDDLSYRIFNYPQLDTLVNNIFAKFDFTYENICKYLPNFTADYLAMINNNPNIINELNNKYDEDKSIKLVEIIKIHIQKEEVVKKEQERLLKEKEQKELEEFKKQKFDINAKILVENEGKPYPISAKTEFSYILTNFKMVSKFRSEYDLINEAKTKTNFELILSIVNDVNPFSTLEYIVRVINGAPFNSVILDNINHVLDKVTLKTSYHFSGIKGEKNYLSVVCKFLMIYFGIGCESNKEKAEQYLMVSCGPIANYKPDLDYLRRLIGNRLMKLLVNYPENVDIYASYKEFFMQNEIDYMGFKSLKKYLSIKKNELSDDKLCELIDTISYDNLLHKAIVSEYKEIYEAYVQAKLLKAKQEQEAKEAENKKKLEEAKQKEEAFKEQIEKIHQRQSKYVDESYKAEQIEELKEKTDDAKAMWAVGHYYFHLSSNDRLNFITAYKYFYLSGTLGAPMGYINAAISYLNASTDLDNEQRSDLETKAILLLKEHAEENWRIAYHYLVIINRGTSGYDHTFAKSITDKYINELGEDAPISTLMRAAYYLHIGNREKSMEEFKKIQYKITDTFIVETYVSNLYIGFLNLYNSKVAHYKAVCKKQKDNLLNMEVINATVDEKKFKEEAAKIFELAKWALDLHVSKVVLDFASYYSHGNIFVEKDRKKAYELLLSMNGKYLTSQQIFEKLFEELKSEFNK